MKIRFANGPKVAIHIEIDKGALLSASLSLSSAFECTGADEKLLAWLESYSKGIAPPLFLSAGTPFQRDVLHAMQKIPFGSTLSYSELAQASGHPRAARAAGTACKRNPFPLFIPCHRVIQGNGKLGGFALGLEIKRRLLEFEKN